MVAGAGVIGLAIARRLAVAGREVIVLDPAGAIGTETSSRNSEVIHAGIYYPSGSLKARLCVTGREALYSFCRTRHVPYRKCGKLMVAAAQTEIAGLEALEVKARTNGVHDLEWLTPSQVSRLEPHLRCAGALLSPSTGIIDSLALMLALQGEAERHGAVIAFGTPLVAASTHGTAIEIVTGGGEPIRARCRQLVNAAGLDAPALSRCVAGVDAGSIPTAYLAKGSYFTLAGRAPFRRLIYPMPEAGGLGVHLTLDMAGQARFGPDVEWIERRDYSVDPRRAGRFYAAIRGYWPGLPDNALAPGYAGIRPKISGPDESAADFAVHGPAETGVPGYAALYGIESPGLTACLSLADLVAEKLGV